MLPQEQKIKLDGIVQTMIDNGESDSNIRFIIDDFKKKYTPVENTTPKPQRMPILTNEQGGVGTALKDVAVGAAKSFTRGAVGTASLLQDIGKAGLEFIGFDTTNSGIKSLDTSTPEGADVQETLKSKSRAEQVGTVLETAAELGTGFVKSGAQQALKAKKEAKTLNKVFDAITPKTTELTPTEYENLLMKGKITPKTATQPAQYVLSEGEKQVAYKYRNLLQSKDPVKNSINVVDEIVRKDVEVEKFLDKNNSIFNKGEVKNFVMDKLKEVTDVSIPEARVAKLKNSLIDNFLNKLPKKDMKNLWQNRKAFDNSIQKVFSGSPTLQNEIKREFRNAIQEYIAEKTPDNTYRSIMKDMTQLYELSDVINTKAAKEKALSGLRLWIKNNPTKAKVLGWSLGTGAVGVTGNAILR